MRGPAARERRPHPRTPPHPPLRGTFPPEGGRFCGRQDALPPPVILSAAKDPFPLSPPRHFSRGRRSAARRNKKGRHPPKADVFLGERERPKTKSKPSEAGSIWKGGAAAGELADRPSGRRRVCAVQAFCAAGAKPWRRRNSLPPSMCSAERWSRPLGGGTPKERHLLSQMSFFWGTAQQYRCATDRFAPKTKSKPSEAGSIWKGGAAAGELADRPSGRRRVCAVQAFCAAGAKPWRRRNSLPPSMCSAEGRSRPLGGGTQKERHLLSQMSFFLVRLKGLEPPAFRTGI